jgi:hypothetical protein
MSTDKGNVTVRITAEARELLRRLAEIEGRPMQAVLRSALESYRRQRFLDDVNAGYSRLRSDPAAWKSWLAETALWEGTLSDGLVAEPKPRLGGRRTRRKARS